MIRKLKKYPQGGSTRQNPPKVYTDPILYNKAAKMYNDSLALYNMSKLQYDMLNKKGLVGKKQLPVSANNSIDIINNDDMDMTDKDIYNKLKTLKTNNIKLSKTNSPDFSHPYIKPTTMYGEETKGRNKDRFGLIQSVLNTDSSPTFNYFYDTFPKQPVVYKPQPSQQKSKITNNKELLNVKLPSGDVPKGGSTRQNPPKVYTDRKQFEQAQRMYNDSLNLYKFSQQENNYWSNVDTNGKDAYGNNLKFFNNILPEHKKDLDTYGSRIPDKTSTLNGKPFKPNKNIKPVSYNNYHFGAKGATIKIITGVPMYKKPVQPVKYQPSQSYQLANRQSSGIKQQPLVYKPNHPIQKMNRLPMLPHLTPNSNVTMNSGQINVPAPIVQQPKGKPVYGPGNTIIGYNNNMHFTPALQYTGALNNVSNLQDKALLENPDALRQYVSRLDNYRFDKGGIYSQGLNNTINGLNQFSYLSKNSPDNAMRNYYMNMSNYDSNNKDLYSTNQDLYGKTYFDEGGSYEELSNEYNDLREWQDLASMDGDNELYEYLTPDVNRLENSLKSMEDLARFDAMKEDLQRQIIQQPQYQEQPIEGYSPRRPYSNSSNTSEFLPMEFNQFQQVSSKPLKGVQQQVKSYLTKKGLSKNAIAGIMANIEHESSFNPGIYGDQNKSFGLFQHHDQRKDNLLNFLQKRNLNKNSIEGQIDFALSEYPSLINKLNKAVSPQQAADIWVREFEIPANVEKQSKLRQRAALKYMKQGGTLPFFKQYK